MDKTKESDTFEKIAARFQDKPPDDFKKMMMENPNKDVLELVNELLKLHEQGDKSEEKIRKIDSILQLDGRLGEHFFPCGQARRGNLSVELRKLAEGTFPQPGTSRPTREPFLLHQKISPWWPTEKPQRFPRPSHGAWSRAQKKVPPLR